MTVFSFAMLPCIPYEKSFFNLSTMTSIFFCAEGEHTLFLFLKWKRNWSSAWFWRGNVYGTTKDICAFKSAHSSLIIRYGLPNLAEKTTIVWREIKCLKIPKCHFFFSSQFLMLCVTKRKCFELFGLPWGNAASSWILLFLCQFRSYMIQHLWFVGKGVVDYD